MLSRHCYTKKRYIQKEKIVRVEDIQDSEAQKEANIQLQADLQKNRGCIKQSEPSKRYCRYCGQPDYNI